MKETTRKRWLCVVGCFAALAFLLSCGGGRERFAMPMGEAHQALSEIDSLMWRQPEELIGKNAKFMAYTNNRLMEIFSAQYMMVPAIACGNQALKYCIITPTSCRETLQGT